MKQEDAGQRACEGPVCYSLAIRGIQHGEVLVLSAGEPLEIELVASNSAAEALTGRIRLRAIDLRGREVWSETAERSFAVGRSELSFRAFDGPEAPQEGMFVAQALGAPDDRELAHVAFGVFPPVPDIPEQPDSPILVLRDRNVVGKIDAERAWPKLPDYFRFDPIIGRAGDGVLYAMFQENHTAFSERGDPRAQRPTLISSADGGRSWEMRLIDLDPPVGYEQAVRAFGVAGKGQLLVAYNPAPGPEQLEEVKRQIRERMAPEDSELYSENIAPMWNPLELLVSCSEDRGRTWSRGVSVDISTYATAAGLGRFYEAGEGEIWFTCTLVGPEQHDRRRAYNSVIRSRDGGKSWGDVTHMVSGSAECQLLRLASGRWLTTIRTVGRPGDRLTPDGELVNVCGLDKLPIYEKKARQGYLLHKRTFIAESEAGREWTSVRPLTTLVGDTPGELVQVPDGRVVFIYCHRYGPQAGVYARVSTDEGRTWQSELLALLTQANGGYPSSTVLEDGTIVTLTGFSERGKVQAIRWRLPSNS